MLDTAIRPGEAFSLDRDGVHGGHIIVRGKMGEERVPVSKKARDALLRHMTIYRRGPKGLWPQKTQGGFVGMLRRAFKDAGIKKGFPYMLRHTTATLMTDAGASAIDIKQLLRHTTMRMTERYIEQSLTRVAEAQRRFGPLTNWEGSYQQVLHLVGDEGEHVGDLMGNS